MNKNLETAIETIARLPEPDQEIAAELLLQFAARNSAPYTLDPSERVAVREARESVAQGEFASLSEADDILRKPWR